MAVHGKLDRRRVYLCARGLRTQFKEAATAGKSRQKVYPILELKDTPPCEIPAQAAGVGMLEIAARIRFCAVQELGIRDIAVYSLHLEKHLVHGNKGLKRQRTSENEKSQFNNCSSISTT